ncbi:MAG: hypothetical protein FJZ87_05150 [Chloroflexi bacterium]|nr:hypothetical protein [Chloroflexota bacterium]
MSFTDEPIIPTDPEKPQPHETAAQRVRRRRLTRRQMIPSDVEGQNTLLGTLARRAYPSVEFFVYSLLCGAIMGLGYLLDSQALLLLGVLLAPLMTPWVGFLLSILTGAPRHFFETLMALLIGAVLVKIGGLISGLGSRMFLPITLTNVFIHARLWIPELVVLTIGAVLLTASFIRSESKPYLPSLIISYAFFLPVNAAGFGLGSGVEGVWPQGLLVFLVHLALASMFGLLTLFALKLRPSAGGMVFSGALVVAFLAILLTLMGSGLPSRDEAATAFTPTNSLPTSTATLQPASSPTRLAEPTETVTPTLEEVDFTETVAVALTQVAMTRAEQTRNPVLPSPVPLTLSITLPASETPTVTLTIEAQPVYGRINASEGGGANLRQTPNGKFLMTLDNGSIVEVMPEFRQVNGVTWIRVFVTRSGQRVEGWLLESVVLYATPEPNFEPTSTPTVAQVP